MKNMQPVNEQQNKKNHWKYSQVIGKEIPLNCRSQHKHFPPLFFKQKLRTNKQNIKITNSGT
jgi:hypothetical protein